MICRAKKIAAAMVILCGLMVVNAQSLSDFSQRLSITEYNGDDDYTTTSSVQILADSSSQEALRRIIVQSNDKKTGEPVEASLQGYRIGIFFDNGVTARRRAEEIKQQCDSLLSDLHTSISYDNPYFKVSTGYCISQEEAVILLHRVQRLFPRAYLMRERLTPADIVNARQIEVAAAEEIEKNRKLDSLIKLLPHLKEEYSKLR